MQELTEFEKFKLERGYKSVYAYVENGLACVENLEGKWGYINKQNVEVVPCKYSETYLFGFDGVGMVRNGNLYGFVDINGIEVVPCKYSSRDEAEKELEKIGISRRHSCRGAFNILSMW